MSNDLTAGIVRILKPDGSTAGTGFVVSDEGLIATCAHVVKACGADSGEGCVWSSTLAVTCVHVQ